MTGGGSKFLMLLSAPSSSSSSASSASSNLRLLSPLLSFSYSSHCRCYSSSPSSIRLSSLPRRQGGSCFRPFSLFFATPPSSFLFCHPVRSPFSSARALSDGFYSHSVLKDHKGGEKPGSLSGLGPSSNTPWPEWAKLLDCLRARGYLDPSSGLNLTEHEDDVISNAEQLPGDFVAAARACLSFAKDHPDVLGSLSKQDIGIVVGSASSLLFKNIVNSTRRVHTFLDDGVFHHGKAHTVDVMRLLLSHICDSFFALGQDNLQGREIINASVRKLLCELVELWFMDCRLPDSTQGQFLSTSGQSSGPSGQNILMKRGDWICTKCQFMNFARNARCRQCAESRPRRQLTGREWECPQCDFYNYGRNSVCLRCDCKRPVDPLLSTTPKCDLDSEHSEKSELESRISENDVKAQRWFSKVSQLNDASDFSSAVADDDFPEIMPLRKGVNRFVVSTRKTPLERRLADAQYRRNLGNGGFAEENRHQNDGSVGKILDKILGPSSPSPSPFESRSRLAEVGNDSGHIPFTPLPNEPMNASPKSNLEVADQNRADIPVGGIDDVSARGNVGARGHSDASSGSGELSGKVESESSDPSERWFKKVAELHDVTDLASAIPDDEFPEIMPLRKGENRFVISKKKDRSLTSPQYKRRIAMEQANNSNFVPFVPFPPDYFAKKDKAVSEASNSSSTDVGGNSSSSSMSVNIEKVMPKDQRGLTTQGNVSETNGSTETILDGSSMNQVQRGQNGSSQIKQTQNSIGNAHENGKKGLFAGKSLEGSAVKEPDPLDMSEEAKAERWFRRVAQIKDISELSKIPDEDFPEIMPMRKGVNRFVVSKRKTPLERRLTSPQYRRNLPVVSSDPEKGTS
ncbi:zinc finger protein VAR3, chloroplastic-like isoform X2 [Nymphaea colorata]|uniref:zinc finger protein VAR3, chloroplastic-like isoform X2 n=1 Tax=Nymphaea colorata TaxID=210225 RepID=UPI00129EF445|nr:zinc finger protein VAR3, chloroplastic-like isoform X2 [Nymphaea colorata]